jgi:hypothetical protein
MELKTQGTHLFLLDPDAEVPVVLKFKCPTGITGVTTGARSRIDTTCLDATDDMTYASGLGDPGTVSVPFILDSEDNTHQQSFELKKDSRNLQWMVGFSDGVASPTVASGSLVAPTDRSSIAFTAYIADVDIDISTNEMVRGTLTLQRSGGYTANWKEPA